MRPMTEQDLFWRAQYSRSYIEKNSSFDFDLGLQAWRQMLRGAGVIGSILECGSNIGRNIKLLDVILPDARKSIIEISPQAFEIVCREHQLEGAFNGTILQSGFTRGSFDLVFSCGVLIHISPADLLENMRRMFDYSRKYVLLAEYFNRTPVMIEYQGQNDLLFKRDFGKYFVENFPVRVVDYGFLWGHVYDSAGFDDLTWWLFEK
jgi:pseudaminic acid biosynthesis-associated methylase